MTFGYIRCLLPSQTWHSGFWGRAHVGRRSELNTGNLASILQWAEAELGVPEMRTVKMIKMSDVHSFKTVININILFIYCFSCDIFRNFTCWMRCNVIYGISCSQMASIYSLTPRCEDLEKLIKTAFRQVGQNRLISRVISCSPYTKSEERNLETSSFFHEWNQLLQDNGRSHALEGWTERTWKHSKDLLVAQDGFRTVSNRQLHVYASWVLT